MRQGNLVPSSPGEGWGNSAATIVNINRWLFGHLIYKLDTYKVELGFFGQLSMTVHFIKKVNYYSTVCWNFTFVSIESARNSFNNLLIKVKSSETECARAINCSNKSKLIEFSTLSLILITAVRYFEGRWFVSPPPYGGGLKICELSH